MDIARLCAAAALLLSLLIPAPSVFAMEIPVTQPGEDVRWISPEKGLDAASAAWPEDDSGFQSGILITILRFDTAYFDFRLLSSRWDSRPPRPLRNWAEDYGLAAAVNACMYLKDNETATGYMRSGDRTNNPRFASRYGAFFVSGPRQAGLPRAAVLDKFSDDWERLLPLYDNVVQNFRLMGAGGTQIWPENGPRHAVSAVAEDLNGRILFLHCASPVSVNEFVRAISAHRLNLNSAMYTEGGKEASLLLDSPGGGLLRHGFSAAGVLLSSMGENLELPNILGAVRASRP
ncbi:MAG: phosphodiester glycosidase family protein [Mailhella sp.]|nr:phosphodiester glycosidase family protein [Mailhella sp.]